MSSKRVGQIVEIIGDGRRGIIYKNDFPIPGDRLKVNLVDKNNKPLYNETTKKQQVLFKKGSELKVIGFVD